MSDTSQGQMSHADRHDLDKLARWKEGLDASADSDAASFPVCAIFLVAAEDRASHDIFRRYRSAFEELGGGFHNLVIFGQHGISTTLIAFLEEIGLGQDSVPLVAIVPLLKGAGSAYCIELPKGDRDGELDDSHTWGGALEQIRVIASGQSSLFLDGMNGVAGIGFVRGSLVNAVAGVLADLSSKA